MGAGADLTASFSPVKSEAKTPTEWGEKDVVEVWGKGNHERAVLKCGNATLRENCIESSCSIDCSSEVCDHKFELNPVSVVAYFGPIKFICVGDNVHLKYI